MTRISSVVLSCLLPLLVAPRASAQDLPAEVVGLVGMRCVHAERALARAGAPVERVPGSLIWESGARDMQVRTLQVSGTGLLLYCGSRGRIVGFAAGRDWGERIFGRVLPPSVRPFTPVEDWVSALGEPAAGSFGRFGGDGGGTWVRDGLLIQYSVCLRC